LKYINSILKVKFGLNTTSKSKPVAGPDNLLLILVQYWARNESVFPTKDDRYNITTIILFQAYTGGRPAEFIYLLKGKASKDPLGKREETSKKVYSRKAVYYNYNNNSNTDNKPECNNNSNTGDNNVLFDSKDNGSNNSTTDKDIDECGCSDSGYSSNRTDITITKNTDKCYTAELNKYGQPL
jgi:hypothetical protein